MAKRNRFLNLPYLTNTLAIKAKALELKIKRGSYPFAFFKNKKLASNELNYQLKFDPHYHALTYLNFANAKSLHSGERSVTQDLIIALTYYNECERNQDLNKDYLLELLALLLKNKSVSKGDMIFYINETYDKFDLNGTYYSGIVQGKAASLLLRCFLFTKNESYKIQAKKSLQSCWKSVEDGGVMINLPDNQIWIEEYPSPKPSMVLNGFLFYIIGLAEYVALTQDIEMQQKLEACLRSVLKWLPNYRLKNGLLYSMYRWNLCNVHYTGIMKYQFEHLYSLTNIKTFKEYMEFTDELTNWNVFKSIV